MREAGRLLKSSYRELAARAKAEVRQVKLAGNPEKQAQAAAKEEARQAKAMTKLQGELAKRVERLIRVGGTGGSKRFPVSQSDAFRLAWSLSYA